MNHLPLAKGTRISARTGGGGGYGPPWQRDVQIVLDDLQDGYISQDRAEADYGLRFQKGRIHLDEAATRQAREQMARTTE